MLIFGMAACGKKPGETVTKKDSMLIYFGMEFIDDADYPIFEYYYPSKEFENTDFAHIVMVYKGEYKNDFKYGDIVTTSKPIDLSSYDLKFTEYGDKKFNPYAKYHEIDRDTEFSYKGSVFNDMEKKTLIVTNERYWTDYEENFTTLTLKDKDERVYSYSYLWRNPEEGRPDILNNDIGDTIDFAIYKNNAILMLADGKGLPKGEKITPDVNSSFDKEAFFIYVGQEGSFPVFDYFTLNNQGTIESLDSQLVFFRGVLPANIKYGDVFVASEGEVKITRGRNLDDNSHEREFRVSYELSLNTRLEYIGNGFDIMPKKKFIVGECDYVGFNLFSCTLVDPDFTAFYTFEYYAAVNEVDLNNYDKGKQVEFICYKNTLILPAKQ